ncbi:MAG: ATP-binding protein, partial [Acetobacteraceae bacterium]|nr:ATP-binding protein [Acetobacteraceae bacterium]
MQAPVSDFYAIHLADAFYRHLSAREHLLPSRALADARKELERARLAALQRGAPTGETQPEYATATLFVAGPERPIADFALDKQELTRPPVYVTEGPVPQLGLGELIGRRKELRETLRTLRDPARPWAGVVLTGIGGVGKSALAGRVMCRLAEDGWLTPAHRGRFDLTQIAVAVGAALIGTGRDAAEKIGERLARPDLPDQLRLNLLADVLAKEPILLVLDDFEQNLSHAGDAFLDPDVAEQLSFLADRVRKGRLLITCRYPVPGAETALHRVPIGPLSPAETRKKLLRLPGLSGRNETEVKTALRVIGGHPRMLEFLDALLVAGEKRIGRVAKKLRDVAAEQNIDIANPSVSFDENVQRMLQLGARDVLLDELVEISRAEGIAEHLFQTAVSNLPVTADGLARMLADGEPGDRRASEAALTRLEELSLVHRFPDGTGWVHRWTAEALSGFEDAEALHARCRRAGYYRLWRVRNESRSIDHLVEAVRNFLAAKAFDQAVQVAQTCFAAFERFQQSVATATLAAEVLETLPEAAEGYAVVA